MSKNVNLKWQECIDLGYRADSRNNAVDANQPVDADDHVLATAVREQLPDDAAESPKSIR